MAVYWIFRDSSQPTTWQKFTQKQKKNMVWVFHFSHTCGRFCYLHCSWHCQKLFCFLQECNLSKFWVLGFGVKFSKTSDLQQRARGARVGKSQFQVYGTVVLSQHMVEPIDSLKQFDKVHSFVLSFGSIQIVYIIHVIGLHNILFV